MNKRLKRLAATVLTLVMMFTVFTAQMLTSYAATGKITFSDPTVTVGNQVSVKMKIASSDGGALGASDVRLQYDSSALEFLSGTSANGGAGSIRVLGAMESANQTTFTFTLKFKALKAGTTNIKVTSQEVYDANSQVVTIDHVGSSAVKVTAPVTYSKDATLSSLNIAPGELTPAFAADVTEYTAVVGADVEKLTISAPANHDKANVAVSGNEALQIGENTITCKVTAEDGETVKTYTILVTKTESAPTESTEETPAATTGGSATNLEDGNWKVEASIDASILPDGFTLMDFTYDGEAIQAASDANGNVLLYMTNDAGAGDFFLYDVANNVLVPYVYIRMAEKTVIVLSPEEMPEGTALPDGFVDCTIDIGNHTVQGWVWKDNSDAVPEYCVVYGQNEDGERGFYRYDQKEMTLQRFFKDPDAENLRTQYNAIAETYSNLLEDYNSRGRVIAALFGACILLVIVIIVLLLTRRPKAAAVEEEVKEFIPTERRKAANAQKRAKEEEELELVDLEEEEIPKKKPVEKKAPAKKNAPKKPAQPEKKTVEEMERDLAKTLAKEAESAKSDEKEEDDDFEFIDLEL